MIHLVLVISLKIVDALFYLRHNEEAKAFAVTIVAKKNFEIVGSFILLKMEQQKEADRT